ncbi:fimbrial major subunit CsuA/B family protein [Sphingomonas changnyeongensis]|uniref:Fimbrial major subunit CsuA/B family protein n=1 Tax=Sphingomonas changnyeongensis TaxID=2698679 RepID=A0A7Z2NW59_9SPHN|nr:spore coat protein U domain-containing protein [Sphingomonas changnyeongensis]QHL90519.1 fimbrial major subunit CsuA/B family protein [Sphingomonas changnyeongensis]
MKKLLIAAAVAALATGSASAQTSVNIPLSGTLAKSCTISAFLNGPFDALDLTSTNVQGAESLTTSCNYDGANQVTFTSQNNGVLKSGNNTLAYEFGIPSANIPLAGLTAPRSVTYGSGAPAGSNFTRSMVVRLPAAATIAGTYTDTIVATVTPN